MKKSIFAILALICALFMSCATKVPSVYTNEELDSVKESKILRLENITLNGKNEIQVQLADDNGYAIANKNCKLFVFLDEDFEDIAGLQESDLAGRDDVGVIHIKTDSKGWIFVKNIPGSPNIIIETED